MVSIRPMLLGAAALAGLGSLAYGDPYDLARYSRPRQFRGRRAHPADKWEQKRLRFNRAVARRRARNLVARRSRRINRGG